MANDIRIVTAGFKSTSATVEPVTQIGRDWFEDRYGLATKVRLPLSEMEEVLQDLYHCGMTHEIRDGAWRYLNSLRG